MRFLTLCFAVLGSWHIHGSEIGNESIYQETMDLTNSYVLNDCLGNYNGRLSLEAPFTKCKEIYRQFFDFLGLVSRSDGFPEYAEYLWSSEDIVLSNDPLFRSAVAAFSARLDWAQRPFLSDSELEILANDLLRNGDLAEELLINGLLILGSLGDEKYIGVLKSAALNNRQRVAVVAVFSLSKIIDNREQLKHHLRDVYDQTDSTRFKAFLDRYVGKRGGW